MERVAVAFDVAGEKRKMEPTTALESLMDPSVTLFHLLPPAA